MVIFNQSKAELYLEVKGSNPIEVLCFCFVLFQGFLRKHINCVHNYEDNSSFDFISTVLINIYMLFYFIYICHMYLYYKCPTEVYFTRLFLVYISSMHSLP